MKHIMLFSAKPGPALIRGLSLDPNIVNWNSTIKKNKTKRGKTEKEIAEGKIAKTAKLEQKELYKREDKNAPNSDTKFASIEGKSEFNLLIAPAKGEVSFELEFPEMGDKIRNQKISFFDKNIKENREVDIGDFFCYLKGKAWGGGAGASLVASGVASLSVHKSKLSFGSVYNAVNPEINGKLDVFFGAQAGINLMGELRWVPPKDLWQGTQILALDPQQQNYRVLSSLDVDMAAAVGAGLTGNIGFGLYQNKLYFVCKLSAIWGLGVKGSVAFLIDHVALIDLVRLLGSVLRDVDYTHLDFITPEAFMFIAKYYNCLVIFGAGILLTIAFSTLIDAYDKMMLKKDVESIANRFLDKKNENELREWIKIISPEALGQLLNILISRRTTGKGKLDFTYNKEIIAKQQEVIQNILQWIVDGGYECRSLPFISTKPNNSYGDSLRDKEKILFEKTMVQMYASDDKVRKITKIYNSLRRLDEFMRYPSALREEDHRELYRNYSNCVKLMSNPHNRQLFAEVQRETAEIMARFFKSAIKF